MRIALAASALAFVSAAACAQVAELPAEPRSLEINGERVDYMLRRFAAPPAAQPTAETQPAALAPDSPVNSARLMSRHLTAGDIEEAALLSNSPRRRFEVLKDYLESVGEAEFKRVYAQYFDPRNPLVAEIAIGRHHVLVWRLDIEMRDEKRAATRFAAQYYIEVEGRYLLDDVPSEERTRLRRVFDAYRTGRESFGP
jgi:hypothetical protein